jgi:hypothetical protein
MDKMGDPVGSKSGVRCDDMKLTGSTGNTAETGTGALGISSGMLWRVASSRCHAKTSAASNGSHTLSNGSAGFVPLTRTAGELDAGSKE